MTTQQDNTKNDASLRSKTADGFTWKTYKLIVLPVAFITTVLGRYGSFVCEGYSYRISDVKTVVRRGQQYLGMK